jgi:hypothetical protein
VKVKILQPVHPGARSRGADRGLSLYPAAHGGVSHGEKLANPAGVYEVDDEYGAQLIAEGKAVKA